MPNIAIIDDNTEQSSTLATTMSHYLKDLNSDLNVITQTPFENFPDYFPFIQNNDVCVLILDEKLNVVAEEGRNPVIYLGNELVVKLREQLKDFPIFMVSNYIQDDDLQEKFDQFDNMFTRSDLTEDADGKKFIPIIVRSAQRYLKSNNAELSEFNQLTQDIASGDQDPSKMERLRALQVKLQIPFTAFDDRAGWLDKYQEHISELDELEKELAAKISKQ